MRYRPAMPGHVAATTDLDPRLRAVRTADVRVTVLQGDSPLAGHHVVVEQRSHRFGFGSTGMDLIGLANDEGTDQERSTAEVIGERWLELFNLVTLPFYWARFEPERGHPDTQRIQAAARWFAQRSCRVKGHPLTWHTLAPEWLLPLTNAEVQAALTARIHRDVSDFAGLIDTWDVVNEAVIMPVFDRYDNAITRLCRQLGRVETVRLAFDAARATNPDATLLLNDFDVSVDYEHLVEACLDAGVQIDVLGIQSHMHQGYWGEEKTLDVLERFSRFGLPIHFTESTLVSGKLMPPEIEDLNDYQVADWPSTPEGEARQADEAVRHYTTLLADPAVEAITWWGLPDGGWLNAPSGLVRADGSPKPAYDALHALIKGAWWLPPTPMTTDADGRLRVSGWLGDYEVTIGGRTVGFSIDRAVASVVVRLDA